MKTISIHGRRYRLTWIAHYEQIEVNGPGILGGFFLPEGFSFETPNLRQYVETGLEEYRERRRIASEEIQKRVREGIAGLSNPTKRDS